MMPQKLPLQSLMLFLEEAGFEIDPRTQLKIQRILIGHGSDYLLHPEKLASLIGPLVVQNEQEQFRFRQVFAQYLEYLSEEGEQEYEETQQPRQFDAEQAFISRKVNNRRTWTYVSAAVLFVSLLILYKLSFQSNEDQQFVPDIGNEIAEIESIPETADIPEAPRKELSEILHPGSILVPPNPAYTMTPQTPSKGEVILLNNPQAVLSQIEWEITNLKTGEKFRYSGHEARHLFEYAGWYQIRSTAKIAEKYKYLLAPGVVEQASTEKTLLVPLAINTAQENFRMAFAQQEAKQDAVKLTVFALALFLILLIEFYLHSYKRHLYRVYYREVFKEDENGPYEMQFDPKSLKLDAEPELYSLAEQMRQRKVGMHQELNIPATLYATIQKGGFPSLAYTNRTVPSEYLILIDESSPENHQAQIFKQLVGLLKAEEVQLSCYLFRNDPRECYAEGSGDVYDLQELAQKYPQHRLIMFSQGSFLINIREEKLQPWVMPIFEHWEERILLTANPAHQWGFREQLLEEAFNLLPTDMESQLNVVEALSSNDHWSVDSIRDRALARAEHQPDLDQYNLENVDDLQAYLGDALFEWLAATTVYPKSSWEVQLQIGKALEQVQDHQAALLSFDNLTKLSRIPWLNSGKMPEQLRAELYDRLDTDTEQLARESVLNLLYQAEQEPGSPAYQEQQVQQTIQEAALDPDSAESQRKMRFLYREGLLNKWADTVWKQQFQPSVWLRYRLGMIVRGLGAMVLLGLVGSFSWMQISSHTDEALLKTAIKAYPEAGMSFIGDDPYEPVMIQEATLDGPVEQRNPVWDADYVHIQHAEKQILQSIGASGYVSANALPHIEKLSEIHFEDQIAEAHKAWLTVLLSVQAKQYDAAKNLLNQIRQQPEHPYYVRANNLYKGLHHFWRF